MQVGDKYCIVLKSGGWVVGELTHSNSETNTVTLKYIDGSKMYFDIILGTEAQWNYREVTDTTRGIHQGMGLPNPWGGWFKYDCANCKQVFACMTMRE
jgi:hypothetical protein